MAIVKFTFVNIVTIKHLKKSHIVMTDLELEWHGSIVKVAFHVKLCCRNKWPCILHQQNLQAQDSEIPLMEHYLIFVVIYLSTQNTQANQVSMRLLENIIIYGQFMTHFWPFSCHCWFIVGYFCCLINRTIKVLTIFLLCRIHWN